MIFIVVGIEIGIAYYLWRIALTNKETVEILKRVRGAQVRISKNNAKMADKLLQAEIWNNDTAQKMKELRTK